MLCTIYNNVRSHTLIYFLSSMVQIQFALDRSSNGPLVREVSGIALQLGLNIMDLMAALRTSANFIGSFRVQLMQTLSHMSMFDMGYIQCVSF